MLIYFKWYKVVKSVYLHPVNQRTTTELTGKIAILKNWKIFQKILGFVLNLQFILS